MIATLFDAPEALGEYEVADDIERQEVEPGDHVKDLAALLAQLGEPEVNVFLYDWLLLVHALGTKSMIELAPQPLVVLVGPADWYVLITCREFQSDTLWSTPMHKEEQV